MFKNLVSYINNKEYFIGIYENKIYIYNYKEIIDIQSKSIKFYIQNKKVIINGKNLFIDKLEDNCALITGNFKGIEIDD